MDNQRAYRRRTTAAAAAVPVAVAAAGPSSSCSIPGFVTCPGPTGTPVRCSIVVSISACHAEDPGSIPGCGFFFMPVPLSGRDRPRQSGAIFSSPWPWGCWWSCRNITLCQKTKHSAEAAWSSGMILASGARAPGFNSRSSPSSTSPRWAQDFVAASNRTVMIWRDLGPSQHLCRPRRPGAAFARISQDVR